VADLFTTYLILLQLDETDEESILLLFDFISPKYSCRVGLLDIPTKTIRRCILLKMEALSPFDRSEKQQTDKQK